MRGLPCVCCLLLFAAPILAQGRSATLPIDRTVVVERKGYRVSFSRDTVSFASDEAEVSWELLSVGRRAGSASLPALASRHWVGAEFHYERGTLTETYELRADGMKQSFTFDVLPPGTGDLVVRLRVRTREPLVDAGAEEVYFGRSDTNGLRIEEVVGIDANGDRALGSLRWLGGDLELVLPEAFVEGAALPVTVDPLVTEGMRIASFPSTRFGRSPRIAVAYLPGADRYYAAWTDDSNPIQGASVSGRVLLPNGRPGGGIQVHTNLISGPHYLVCPQIASVRATQRFVVLGLGGIFGVGPWVNWVDPAGNLGKPNLIPGNAQCQDVASNATATGTHVILVGVEDFGRVTVRQLDSVSLLVLGTTLVDPVIDTVREVAISSSGGSVGRYLVVWREKFFDGDVFAAVMDDDLNLLAGPFVIANTGFDEAKPEVDGDGTEWIVAWERTNSAGDRDILARSVRFDSGTGTHTLGQVQEIEADVGQEESLPSVSWTGVSYLIGFSEEVGGDRDAFITSVDSAGIPTSEGKIQVFALGTNDQEVRMASQRSAGGTRHRVLLAWESEQGGPRPRPATIGGRLYTPRDGLATPQQSAPGTSGAAGRLRVGAGERSIAEYK